MCVCDTPWLSHSPIPPWTNSIFSSRIQSNTNAIRSVWCWRNFVLTLVNLSPILRPEHISNSSTKTMPSQRSVCKLLIGFTLFWFNFTFTQRRNVRHSWMTSSFIVLLLVFDRGTILITMIVCGVRKIICRKKIYQLSWWSTKHAHMFWSASIICFYCPLFVDGVCDVAMWVHWKHFKSTQIGVCCIFIAVTVLNAFASIEWSKHVHFMIHWYWTYALFQPMRADTSTKCVCAWVSSALPKQLLFVFMYNKANVVTSIPQHTQVHHSTSAQFTFYLLHKTIDIDRKQFGKQILFLPKIFIQENLSSKPNEIHYILLFCFFTQDLVMLRNVLSNQISQGNCYVNMATKMLFISYVLDRVYF